MKVALLRESGGIGDVISMSGASYALKRDKGCEVVAFVPQNFVGVASHLYGVDEVVSLPRVEELAKNRRMRESPLKVGAHEYLTQVLSGGYDEIIDLYCPGFFYEQRCKGREEYTRSQLFALRAGASQILDCTPRWAITESEREFALDYVKRRGFSVGEFIVAGLRGTCRNRVLPAGYSHSLLSTLVSQGVKVIYGDSTTPHFPLVSGVDYCRVSFPQFVAIVSLSKLVVCMDSSLLHIAQAVGVRSISIHIMSDGTQYKKWYNSLVIEPLPGNPCSNPCHYNRMKGWDRKCRETGCVRMKRFPLQMIIDTVIGEIKST